MTKARKKADTMPYHVLTPQEEVDLRVALPSGIWARAQAMAVKAVFDGVARPDVLAVFNGEALYSTRDKGAWIVTGRRAE